MVRPEVIRKRLNKLDEYLLILKKIAEYRFDKFIKDPEKYGSAERFLHLAIESTLDIGNHIIAENNLGTINWYSDIPVIFEKEKIIDSRIKDNWIQMIGFRNMLVHDYLEIDHKIVYDLMQSNLRDFEELKNIFAHFL